ncbi:MAG: sulfatase-like hydrolase/transferase [Planctomycetaceae bacterium]
MSLMRPCDRNFSAANEVRPENSSTAAVCTAMVVWLLSSLLVAWFEFNIFWDLPLLLFAMNLNVADQTLVVWSLWARTLLVTLPSILVIAGSLWTRRFRALRLVAWTWHWLVLAWLIIDCGLQCVTGASLWHYVEKAMVTEDWALGGDVSAITEGIQSALWITGMRIVGLFIICHVAFQRLQQITWRHLKTTQSALMLFAAIVMTGIMAARPYVRQQPALEQLYGAMAFRTWLFHPDRVACYGTAAFGTDCDAQFADAAAQLHRLCKASSVGSANVDSTNVDTTDVDSTNGMMLPRATATRVALRDTPTANTRPLDAADAQRPNVVVLFTESIRYSAFCAEHTPKLARRMNEAFVAQNHFTNSNCSELGAFSCLYSRFPLSYDDTLNQQIPSAAAERFRQMGYERQLVTSCSVNFSRMNEFLGPVNFDRTSIHSPKGNPWHDNDRRTLAEIADIVVQADRPQFVFSILMATHYSYDYPPHYDQHPPACVPPLPANASKTDLLKDRYFKALAFLDEEFDAFLATVADTNTIVVITGDHGESFLDDGFLCHGTRLSDIQSRTPLLMFGPGVPAQRISFSTSHVDIMPTLVKLARADSPLAESHGQDILSLATHRDQLLTMAHTNEWDVMLVGNDARLGLKLPRSGSDVKVVGFFDHRGRIDLSRQKSPSAIPEWTGRLHAVLRTP